jgi:serine protease Do
METGTISRGFLGVVIQNITPDLADSFGLDNTDGVLVARVTEGSAADRAGVEIGDVIVSFDDTPVRKVGWLRNMVSMSEPESGHTLTVLRNGSEKKLTVTLGVLETSETSEPETDDEKESLGITVQDLNEELAQQFGYEGETGVVVTAVKRGSPAALAGIRPGALILQVDRKEVKNVREFVPRVRSSIRQDGSVLFLVRQGGHSRFIVLETE